MINLIVKIAWVTSLLGLPLFIQSCGSDGAVQETAVTGGTPETAGGNSGQTSVGTGGSCSIPSDVPNPCENSKIKKIKCIFTQEEGKKTRLKIEGRCENRKKFKLKFLDGKKVDATTGHSASVAGISAELPTHSG